MHQVGLTERERGLSFLEDMRIGMMIDWVFLSQFDAKASPVKLQAFSQLAGAKEGLRS